jgi:4-alpha-glucanotransferase
MLRAVYSCQSDLAIVQMQDLLELDDSARFNDPSGKHTPWTWRALPGCFDEKLSAKLKEKMMLYCRYNWGIKEKPASK